MDLRPSNVDLTTAERRQRQLAAVRHGLRVRAAAGRQLRDRRVRRLARKVFGVLPWLEPSDEPAVRAWCELEILAANVVSDLLTRGHANDESGEPRRLLDEYRRLKLAQLAYARELGMTPAARAALGLTVAQSRHEDVAAQLARLRLERDHEVAE